MKKLTDFMLHFESKPTDHPDISLLIRKILDDTKVGVNTDGIQFRIERENGTLDVYPSREVPEEKFSYPKEAQELGVEEGVRVRMRDIRIYPNEPWLPENKARIRDVVFYRCPKKSGL